MKRLVSARALAAALVLAACVGSEASTPGGEVAPAASISQNLTFTGSVAGTMTSATAMECSITPGRSFRAVLQGQVGSTSVVLQVDIEAGYTGPGKYGPTYTSGSSGFSETGPTVVLSPGGVGAGCSATRSCGNSERGSLAINSDQASGSMDMTTEAGEHVTGTWKCK